MSQVSELFHKRNNLCHHINFEFMKRKKRVNIRHKGHHKIYEPFYQGRSKEKSLNKFQIIILFKILTVMIYIIKILEFHVDNLSLSLSLSLRNLCFNKQKKGSRISNECSWILLKRIYAITSLFSLTRDEIFPRFFLTFPCFFSSLLLLLLSSLFSYT